MGNETEQIKADILKFESNLFEKSIIDNDEEANLNIGFNLFKQDKLEEAYDCLKDLYIKKALIDTKIMFDSICITPNGCIQIVDCGEEGTSLCCSNCFAVCCLFACCMSCCYPDFFYSDCYNNCCCEPVYKIIEFCCCECWNM